MGDEPNQPHSSRTMSGQIIYFHGTNEEAAVAIRQEGFRAGTWFASHMEDSVAFGGPIVFMVELDWNRLNRPEGCPDDYWQFTVAEQVPASAIRGEYAVGCRVRFDMPVV